MRGGGGTTTVTSGPPTTVTGDLDSQNHRTTGRPAGFPRISASDLVLVPPNHGFPRIFTSDLVLVTSGGAGGGQRGASRTTVPPPPLQVHLGLVPFDPQNGPSDLRRGRGGDHHHRTTGGRR